MTERYDRCKRDRAQVPYLVSLRGIPWFDIGQTRGPLVYFSAGEIPRVVWKNPFTAGLLESGAQNFTGVRVYNSATVITGWILDRPAPKQKRRPKGSV